MKSQPAKEKKIIKYLYKSKQDKSQENTIFPMVQKISQFHSDANIITLWQRTKYGPIYYDSIETYFSKHSGPTKKPPFS